MPDVNGMGAGRLFLVAGLMWMVCGQVRAQDVDAAALYGRQCAACHGEDLRGSEQGPPFLNAIYRPGHHPDVAFLVAVRSGVRPHHWNFGEMPPIVGLNDEQVAAIIKYVRTQQRDAGIE